MVTRAITCALVACLCACTTSRTEIIVVTDTDVPVPAGADAIHLVVTSPDGRTQMTDADLRMDGHLPRTTTLAWDQGPLGPFVVHAVLRHDGADLVDRTARVSFLRGRLVTLRLDLLDACRGVACGTDATCANAGCTSIDVDADSLPLWSGHVPMHLQEVMPDGGPSCVPSTEICNGIDDDCDGSIDETTDLAADPANCGGCGHACGVVPHAGSACVLGVCKAACDPQYADCNGVYGDGCETSLTTAADCGGCALECTVAHATPSCSSGDCSLSTCAPGWDSCDRVSGVPDVNGCETSVSNNPARCGSCTNPCPSPPHAGPVCTVGACGIVCDGGWADCNGRVDDGCEASLADPATCGDCATACIAPTSLCSSGSAHDYTCVTACTPPEQLCGSSCVDTTQSADHCGLCGVACPTPAHGAAVCVASACGTVCDDGYADCNGSAADGCEAPLVTITDCGACGSACAPPHATGVCGDGTCALGSCDTGWADCNGRIDDGCEVHVAVDVAHCGTCATSCPAAPAHGSPICGASGCAVTCEPGFGDCNADPTDGCERDLTTPGDCGACSVACATGFVCQRDAMSGLASCVGMCGGPADPTHMLCGATCTDVTSDVTNCGACSVACAMPAHAMPTCTASTCGALCDPGFGDCDTSLTNGCETATSTSPMHCGNCATTCAMHAHAMPTCSAGTCGSQCSPGFADCTTADGCETTLGTMTACTHCGDICPTGAPQTDGSMCTAHGCVLDCQHDRYNCDGILSNGCELHRSGQPNACAACGHPCTVGHPCCSDGTCATGAMCPP